MTTTIGSILGARRFGASLRSHALTAPRASPSPPSPSLKTRALLSTKSFVICVRVCSRFDRHASTAMGQFCALSAARARARPHFVGDNCGDERFGTARACTRRRRVQLTRQSWRRHRLVDVEEMAIRRRADSHWRARGANKSARASGVSMARRTRANYAAGGGGDAAASERKGGARGASTT